MNDKGRFVKGGTPWNKGKTGIYSEETRQKIREARARQIFPVDYSETMSKALMGRKHTWGNKISEAKKRQFRERGFINTPEVRAKISASMIASEKFQRVVHSEARRMKISAGGMGRLVNEATRSKLKTALTGKPWTKKHRQAFDESMALISSEKRHLMTVKMLETQRRNGRLGYVSKTEKLLLDALELELGIVIERQFRLGRKLYDGRCGQILIEVDGIKWHTSAEQQQRDRVKDALAASHGFLLIRIPITNHQQIRRVIANHRAHLLLIFKEENRCLA